MVDKLEVERDKLKTAYLALLTISQEDDGPLGRYAAKIAKSVEPAATLSTPTEDARERVKVLDEALQTIASECDRMRKGTDDWFDLVEISLTARTALGNKETDRHG